MVLCDFLARSLDISRGKDLGERFADVSCSSTAVGCEKRLIFTVYYLLRVST